MLKIYNKKIPLSIQQVLNKIATGELSIGVNVQGGSGEETLEKTEYTYTTMTVDGEIEQKVSSITETYQTYKLITSFSYDSYGNVTQILESKEDI